MHSPRHRPVPPRTGHLGYSYYVVVLLLLAYMLSLTDRIILGFLIEPVRAELLLNDTQIGLLLGFGFVLFYSVLGIPLGAWADVGNRRNLIVGGVVVWSLATAGSAFATSFAGLLLARTMVGAGEATLTPCAVSTIGDRFPREKAGFALSLYSLGGAFGMGLGMSLGGYLVDWTRDIVWTVPVLGSEIGGWRIIFVLVGLAGLPFALLMLLTMREAPRTRPRANHPPLRDVFAHILRHRLAFFGLLGGFGAQVLATYAPLTWAAAHFQRLHQVPPLQLGMAFTVIFGVAVGLSVIVGGLLNDRWMRRGVSDAPARVLFWSIPLQLVFIWPALTSQDTGFALWMLGFQCFAASLYGGLQGAIVQVLTPPAMHGRMMAIHLFVVTMIGMGAGPLIVGALSQHAFDGPGALGWAMATAMTGALIVAAAILTLTRGAMLRCIAEVARQK